jgi:hypothetical protein
VKITVRELPEPQVVSEDRRAELFGLVPSPIVHTHSCHVRRANGWNYMTTGRDEYEARLFAVLGCRETWPGPGGAQ